MRPRILILGGTLEARKLADRLAPKMDIITSLAGRTKQPLPLSGTVRVGGFGGVEGLVTYLNQEQITHLINATHPYAARMGCTAETAARLTGIPVLHLERPAWEAGSRDRWIHFDSVMKLSKGLPDLGTHALVTLGGANLSTFNSVCGIKLTFRAIDPPEGLETRRGTSILLERGPFDFHRECALLSAMEIDVLVTRNSGGNMTYAKIEAARAKGITVAMLKRPERSAGVHVKTVDQAVKWVKETPCSLLKYKKV